MRNDTMTRRGFVATSGSSGINAASDELKGLAPGAEWIGARRFAAGATEAEVAEWADSLGIR